MNLAKYCKNENCKKHGGQGSVSLSSPRVFHCKKRGQIIYLSGDLDFGAYFLTLSGILEKTNYIDLSGLITSTWDGVISLLRYLDQTRRDVIFSNVPIDTLKILRLFSGTEFKFEFKIESIYFGSDANHGGREKRIGSEILLTKDIIESKEKGKVFLGTRKNQNYNTALNFMLLTVEGRKWSEVQKFSNEWANDNFGQISFWLGYLEFFESSLSSALAIHRKINSVIHSRLRDIFSHKRRIDQSFKFLGIDNSNSLGASSQIITELGRLSELLDSFFETLSAETSSKKNALEKFTENTAERASKNKENVEELKGILVSTEITNTEIASIVSAIEEYATSITAFVIALSKGDSLANEIDLLSEKDIDDRMIEGLRASMSLTDSLGFFDWQWTKEELLQEVEDFDSEIYQLFLDLQEFDLLAQLLGHLIGARTKISMAASDKTLWADLHVDLADLVSKNLLTDWEKSSFEYCFTRQKKRKVAEKLAGGELILF